ncbi:unnamed protein product [Prunus armeniaca]
MDCSGCGEFSDAAWAGFWHLATVQDRFRRALWLGDQRSRIVPPCRGFLLLCHCSGFDDSQSVVKTSEGHGCLEKILMAHDGCSHHVPRGGASHHGDLRALDQ